MGKTEELTVRIKDKELLEDIDNYLKKTGATLHSLTLIALFRYIEKNL